VHRPDESFLAVRRNNVVFYFSWIASSETVQTLGQQIDGIIRDDRAVAPLGYWSEPPEIVSLGLPEHFGSRMVRAETGEEFLVDDGRYVFLDPVFRGLGPREQLRVLVTARSADSSEGFPRRRVTTHVSLDGRPHARVYLPDESGTHPIMRAIRVDGRFLLMIRDSGNDIILSMVAASAGNRIATLEVPFSLPDGVPRPYSAIDLESLAAALGGRISHRRAGRVQRTSLRIPLRSRTQPLITLEDLQIQVHASRDAAQAAMTLAAAVITISTRSPRWAECGEWLHVWGEDPGPCRITFMRGNITVSFRCSSPSYDAVAAAREIDALIVHDRAVAPFSRRTGEQR
jgi:hypothetical protein